MKRKLYLVAMILYFCPVFSQVKEDYSTTKKIGMELDGMIAFSYGSRTVGINVGGPSLKYKLNQNFRIGAGAFPSLVIIDRRAFPRLGVSPSVEYKHWMFIAPYYGYDAENKAIWTFGAGYRFY